MVRLDAEQLREVQLTELEMLREVHRICEKHEIPYVIIAGTLLGAVRGGGFIPWDDDADVAMLRRDYERFREVCRSELDGERFVFQDDRCTPGYRWGYGKLRRKQTLFLREDQEDMPYFQGIFIDIFPLDEVPACWPRRMLWDLACFAVRKALWAPVGKKADKSAWKRYLYARMDRIPEERILARLHALTARSRRLTERTDRRERARGRNGKRYVRPLTFPTPNACRGYDRAWYTERRLYRFESAELYGIREAEDYLRFKYGNYREPPPRSERKTHPVSRLILLSDRRERSEAGGRE